MAHFHLYTNNPTAGNTDGTELSSGTNLTPVTITLNSAGTDAQVAKCAIRCDSGYSVEGGARIYLSGTNASRWQVAADNNYTSATALANASWGSSTTVTSVAASNVIFWAKANCASGENPQNDRSVKIEANATIVAVS